MFLEQKKTNYQPHNGFTLIELILTLIILGVLAVNALPRLISLTSDSRIAAITQINVSAKVANDFMFLKSQLPSYATQQVPNRDDLLDVDTNGDGVFDTRLKWFYLDNTDIEVRVDLSDDFAISYAGIDTTYIGYDFDSDNNVENDNCYFKYVQAANATTPPSYDVIIFGC